MEISYHTNPQHKLHFAYKYESHYTLKGLNNVYKHLL